MLPKGSVFTAKRLDPDSEFLASTDNWFRPVNLQLGPDGAIYMLDFYREAIETPLSLPDDIKKTLNLESRGRGRIWRIAPEGFKPAKFPDFSKLTAAQLADELLGPNPMRRLLAQRLIVERQMEDAAGAIRERLAKSAGKPGHVNLLWALHGLGNLSAKEVQPALDDAVPGIREHAIHLSEDFLRTSPDLADAVVKRINDPEPRVRLQLALSAAALHPESGSKVLSVMLERNAADPWIQTAALSSASQISVPLIEALLDRPEARPALLKLAAMTGAKGDQTEIVKLLSLVAEGKGGGGTAGRPRSRDAEREVAALQMVDEASRRSRSRNGQAPRSVRVLCRDRERRD